MTVKIKEIGYDIHPFVQGRAALIEKSRGKITLFDIDDCLRKAQEDGLWVIALNVGGDLPDDGEKDSVIVLEWRSDDCPLCRSQCDDHFCPDCGFDLLAWKLKEVA